MKGVILAGGNGSRLYPVTLSINKHMLPIYDKPMIFYPLSVLMLAGINQIMIVTSQDEIFKFENTLSNGENLGISISYGVQKQPLGIVDGLKVARDFIGNDDFVLILGDNIFVGNGLIRILNEACEKLSSNISTIFAYKVNKPSDYGVVEIDKNNRIISMEEKPLVPKSNLAITGLYFYPNSVLNEIDGIEPSKRGEYEITTLNEILFGMNLLRVEILGRGFAWFDTGSFDNMFEASQYIKILESRSSLIIGSVHEIAYKQGWLNNVSLQKLLNKMPKTLYYLNLQDLLDEKYQSIDSV